MFMIYQLRDKSATTEIPKISLKPRRLKVKVKPVEFSIPTLTRRKLSPKSPTSLQGASSNSCREVSTNMLEGDDLALPAPHPPKVEESSEVWSQMTQFPSDDVPVRTKPSEAVMMMSSQSSQSSHSSSGSYASALSEQMDEDENLSIDSMKMEEHTEENNTLSKTLNNNDKNVKNAETAMEQNVNESRDQ